MREYVLRNKNIFIISIVVVSVFTITFYLNTSYAIVNGTVYTRDELSELIQNQDSSINELDSLINSNYNAYNIYVNNTKVSSLNNATYYYLDSYTCQIGNTTYTENNKVLNWDMGKQQLSQKSTLNEQMTCDLYFYTDSHYTTTLVQKIYNDNQKVASRTNFSVSFTENTTGKIYYTSTNTESVCDSGDTLTYVSGTGSNAVCKTYYYAGNTTNNYVSFGGQMWQIIRINEDQSVRMQYLGQIEQYTTDFFGVGHGAFQADSIWDSKVGYMYSFGDSSYAGYNSNIRSSGAKGTIEAWYKNSLNLYYNNYVSQTAIYCNDRSIYSGTGISNDLTNPTIFAASYRLNNNKTPQYKCPLMPTSYGVEANHNKFTVSTTTGNGNLIYPVALITADEYIFAGGTLDINETIGYFFLRRTTSNWAWTMTPISSGMLFTMSYYGYLHQDMTQSLRIYKPVLSLKSCVKYVKGTGAENSPYEVIIDSTCSSAIN